MTKTSSESERPSTATGLPDSPLSVLASYPDAAVPVASLPKLFGLGPVECHALVASLMASGELLSWLDHPAVPAVILSTDAAEVLGLELVRVNAATFRWLPPSHPIARRAEAKGRRGVKHLESDLRNREGSGGFDDTPDPSTVRPPGTSHEETRTRPSRLASATRPTLIYGLSPIWPVAPREDGRCRGNHPNAMPEVGYCCFCHVSGSDAVLPEVPKSERPRAATPHLAGGRGPAKRAKKARKAS